MKLLRYLVLSTLLVVNCIVGEAAFESVTESALPPLSIGCVKAYGRLTVREDLFQTFKDHLYEKLQGGKAFRLAEDYTGTVIIKGQTVPAEDFFKVLLMDAIVRGKNFTYLDAGTTLRNYARSKGIVEGKNKSAVYKLSSNYSDAVRTITESNAGRYILLCNLNEVTGQSMKVKQTLKMNYYLVDAERNLVYEGSVDRNENFISSSYGVIFLKIKMKDSSEVFMKLFKEIAEEIVEGIENKGLPLLKRLER